MCLTFHRASYLIFNIALFLSTNIFEVNKKNSFLRQVRWILHLMNESYLIMLPGALFLILFINKMYCKRENPSLIKQVILA